MKRSMETKMRDVGYILLRIPLVVFGLIIGVAFCFLVALSSGSDRKKL